jgi:hypothetical protein
MTEKPVRRFELCTERLETLDDVKKVLKTLHLRIDTDNSYYEELQYYFSVEVVPQGYIQLLEAVGEEAIANMTYKEMETRISLLLETQDEQTN